jgi:hypothetical protein
MIQQLFNPMNRRLPQFIKNGYFEKGGKSFVESFAARCKGG